LPKEFYVWIWDIRKWIGEHFQSMDDHFQASSGSRQAMASLSTPAFVSNLKKIKTEWVQIANQLDMTQK